LVSESTGPPEGRAGERKNNLLEKVDRFGGTDGNTDAVEVTNIVIDDGGFTGKADGPDGTGVYAQTA